MANIKEELDKIKHAVYGKGVRGSIHDGIEKVNQETEQATEKANDAYDVTRDILDESFDSAKLEADFEQRLDDEISNLQPEWTEFKNDTNAQLTEKSMEILKNKSELRRDQERNKIIQIYNNDFTGGIDNWIMTPGIEVAGGSLKQTSGSETHTNVALYNGIKGVRSIQVDVGDDNAHRTRIAFGESLNSWCFITWVAGSYIDIYRVTGGSFYRNSVEVNTRVTPKAGDKIKIVLHNQNFQIYINGDLVGTSTLTPHITYLLPNRETAKAGVAFRSSSDSWEVKKIRITPSKPKKIFHFSIDDCIKVFKNLDDNKLEYNSLFDEPTFNFLRNMHEKYGITVSLYAFYKHHSGWDLSSVPDKFKNEFEENFDWLKIGFHGYESVGNYGNSGKGTPFNSDDAVSHWNLMSNEIIRFASEYSIDVIPRLHYYGGTIDVCRKLRDKANFGLSGFLTSDDSRQHDMYLSDLQRESIELCDDLYDERERLLFIRTDLRIENFDDPLSEIKSRKRDMNFSGQMGILEIFTHEGSSLNRNLEEIEYIFKWALEDGYIFDFQQNFI